MKKLMIAAAIVCAAAMSQAATANWVGLEIANYAGGAASTDQLVYFVDSATYSFTDAQTAIGNGDISFLTAPGTYSQVGEYAEAGVTDTFTADRYGNGQTVTGYLVILDADSIAGAKHVYLVDEQSGLTGGTGTSAYLEFDASGTATPGDWAAVPEPTSGLLLLLGVAGLALKRKRA